MACAKYISFAILCMRCVLFNCQEETHHTLFLDSGEVKFFEHRKFKALPEMLENLCAKYGMQVLYAYDTISHFRIVQYIHVKTKFTEAGYWISNNDRREEGVFLKADGIGESRFIWADDEPNGGRKENCVVMYQKHLGKLADVKCDSFHYPACVRKYGKPRIDYIDEIECQTTLDIRWTVHERSGGLKHRINVQATDDSHAILVDDNAVEPGPRTTRVKGVQNGKRYNIEITICTTICCCGHLIAKITTEPFVGRPKPMKNFKLREEGSECHVSWGWPDGTPPGDITGIKLTIKSGPPGISFIKEDQLDGQKVVYLDPILEHTLTPEVQRQIVVIGQTETCAGLSDQVKADGYCYIGYQSQGQIRLYIPNPTLMFKKQGQILQVALPDEKAATLSCIFVMVKPLPPDEEIVSSSEGTFELSDLKTASESFPSVESTYIAVALPRTYIGEHYEDFELGDGKTTRCNVAVAQEEKWPAASFDQGKGADTTYKGQNFELKKEWSYSFYVVASIVGSRGAVSHFRSASCELSATVRTAPVIVVEEEVYEFEDEDEEGEEEEWEVDEGQEQKKGKTGAKEGLGTVCIVLIATSSVVGLLDLLMLGKIGSLISSAGSNSQNSKEDRAEERETRRDRKQRRESERSEIRRHRSRRVR